MSKKLCATHVVVKAGRPLTVLRPLARTARGEL